MELKPVMKTKTTKRPIRSRGLTTSETPKKVVRIAGLEPARLAALPPQSSVSANSTISATRHKLKQRRARTQVHSDRNSSANSLSKQRVHAIVINAIRVD